MNRNLWALALVGLVAASWAAAQPAAPLAADFGDAVLHDWVQPDYPEAARKAKLEGAVTVEFAVELDGHVTRASVQQSTNELFNAAAVQAAARWTFSPALEDGKPVVSAMSAVIPFRLAQLKQKSRPTSPPGQQYMPVGLKVTPARKVFAPDPDYPVELEDRRLPGEVELEFTVDENGNPLVPQVVWASHAAFVETALRAVEKTKFEPAHQGPVPKTARMKYPVEFQSMGSKRSEVLAANHLGILADPAPEVLPAPVVLIEPVYPQARLLAGEPGSAVLTFLLGENGRTGELKVESASAPEFGAALAAAVEAWLFQPAMTQGARQAVRLRVAWDFAVPAAGSAARLATALKPGGPGVGGAAGLDQKLKPLWRGFPVYPKGFHDEKPAGEATVEFIIDRDGRVRLPRVVSASREEFGWAAATAISQWVFVRPVRQGEPVDVRVAIPVNFPPPADQ